MVQFIRGKKTYLVAGIMVLVTGLKAFGIIDSSVYEGFMGILAALGFGSLRAGVEKAAADIQGSCSQQERQ
jgi:hypothetical protein